MADSGPPEHARRGGDPEGEAQLLLERLRIGETTQGKLELAAHLGHPAARKALGQPGEGPEDWLTGLEGWGKAPLVRVAVACGRWALPTPLGEELRLVEAALEAAEDWVRAPSEGNRVGARLAAEELEAFVATLDAAVDDELVFEVEVITCVARAAEESRLEVVKHHVTRLLDLVDGLERGEAAEARDAMRHSLLSWALEDQDPLAED